MKNRFLPLGLIKAFLGFTMFSFSVLSYAGQPGDPDARKFDGTRWEGIRANQHTGIVSPADVAMARQQAEALRVKSTSGAMGLDWISAGPDNYPGLSWSCIYDKTDPTGLTLISGAAAGGIWKSTNLGTTWTQMAVENDVVPKVSCLIQAANGTIYAATGVTTCKNIRFNGSGIYVSQGGSAFSPIPATQNNPDFNGITKLAIDPRNGRIYASTTGGLFYSDNGNDWTNAKSGYAMDVSVGTDGTVLTAVGDSAYLAQEGNLDAWVTLTTGLSGALPKTGIGWMVFAIAPSDGNIMYASLAGKDGRMLNIYNSTDKGATWSVIFPNNPSFEPFGGYGCYSNTLAVAPNDPGQVYLGGVNMWHGQRIQPTGYYNWEVVSSGLYSPWYPDSAPQFHHSYMFCPTNPDQIVISTDGGISVCTITPQLITFKTINKKLATSQFNAITFSSQRGYVMGGGDRIGTLGMGFFTPTYVNSPTDGYPVWQPYGLILAGNGGTCEWSNLDSRIAVFTQFKGAPAGTQALRRQDLNDLTYGNDFLNGIDTVSSAYIPMRLWESFTFSQTHDSVKYFAYGRDIPADTTLLVESANNTLSFPYVTTQPIPKGDSITIADPIASRFILYANRSTPSVYGKGIYMTKDMLKFYKDPEYFLVFKDPAPTDPITALAVSSDLNTAWAGTKAGRLIRITGLVNAYDSATANVFSSQCVLQDTVYSSTPFTGRVVTSISICPLNTNQVLVTLGNYGNQDYIYYSQDGNSAAPAFASIQSNLPKAPVYSGLIEMHGHNNAIIGTDLGVYSTTDLNSANPQWAADIKNIGDVAVTDIRQQVMHDYHIQNYGVIYLGSYGRGIWMDTTYYAPVGIEPVVGYPTAAGSLKVSPNPVTDVLTVSYDNDASCALNAVVYDLTGRIVLSKAFGNQPKGTFNGTLNLGGLPQGSYFVKVGNASGKVVKL